jgi:hypothetical protein
VISGILSAPPLAAIPRSQCTRPVAC